MSAPLCEEVDTLAMGLSSDEGSGKHRVLHSVSPSDADDLRDRLCLVEFEEQVLPPSHRRRGLHLGARACRVGLEILVEQGSRASLRATSHVGSIFLALAECPVRASL